MRRYADRTGQVRRTVTPWPHLGETDAAKRLEAATAAVILEGKHVTYDLKANRNDPTAVGTREMAKAICDKLKK